MPISGTHQCLLPVWVCHMLLVWQNNIFLGGSKQLHMQANSFSLSPVHNWKADASPLSALRFPEKLSKSENRQQTQSKGMFKILTPLTPTLNSSHFGLNVETDTFVSATLSLLIVRVFMVSVL